MKTLILACAAFCVFGSPAPAQRNQTEAQDGMRYLIPKAETSLNALGNTLQSRAIEMGFYSWPIPTKKVAADDATRPRVVADCGGHDPEYRPANSYSSKDDPRERHIGQARAFIYDWMAYRNAIEAEDCSCGSLKADWPEAVAAFDQLIDGANDHRIYTSFPSRFHSQIKNDFKRMCDVSTLLILE